ncbi:unnamed protein product [Leptosia nina]|uniref:Cytochrome b-c1 complex subunit Rieske, mitochondrial n=1 Tax=Leptosia nina TaxID=320188 RepID=A0AAV1IV80_9NEOP
MFILSSGCMLRASLRIWLSSCCGHLRLTGPLCEDRHTKSQCVQKYSKQYPKTCSKNQILTFYTQVRFKKDYPRLHRDTEFPNFDYYRKDDFKDISRTAWGAGGQKQGITYTVGFFGLLAAMYGVKSELTHFITYMAAPADVLALATIEVDISNIPPGICVSYKWRGKPLFIKHRTENEINVEANTPLSLLRDPQTPEQRMVKQEWLVVIGICTHLGCVPIPNTGDYVGGFYCPCHGSHYDNAGRTRRGPAPLNLEVPVHKFISDTQLLVGD